VPSTYLDSINSFKSYGEILNPEIYPFFQKVANLPFKKSLALFKAKSILREHNSSIKLIFQQLDYLKITLEDLLTHFPSAKFIVIYREHLINSYISYLRAKVTQEWNSRFPKNTVSEKLSFCVDRDDFLQFCDRARAAYSQCHIGGFWGRSVVINYECLVDQPQRLFDDTIFPFLGAAATPINSPLTKQITTPLSELIENFDAVKDMLELPEVRLQFDETTQRFY